MKRNSIACFCFWWILSFSFFPTFATDDWHDTFYQYRIPITIEAKESGWHSVPLTEAQITSAINELEQLKYAPYGPQHFSYNNVKLIAVDMDGDPNIEGGFYLVKTGPNLLADVLSRNKNFAIDVSVQPGAHYLLRYTAASDETSASGLDRHSPMHRYDLIHRFGSPSRKINYISYEPPMLPKARSNHERLFIPESDSVAVEVGGRFVSGIKKIALHRAKIRLLVNLRRAGRHRLMIYYQPMSAYHLMIPRLRRKHMPQSVVRLRETNTAEKHLGQTRYRLKGTDNFELWFAESTVKLTPRTPAPPIQADGIKISAAANEAQSFQIVLSPKTVVRFMKASATNLRKGADVIGASAIDFRCVEYIPISRISDITPASCIGLIGDPLVPVQPHTLLPAAGNRALWVTARISPDTPPGIYHGSIHLNCDNSALEIPLSLEVYDFALPEFSALRTNMGGQYLDKPMADAKDRAQRPGYRGLMGYHGLQTIDQLKKLARAYYTVMAKNKFYPKSVALYSPFAVNWSPPPNGYNVDSPDNFVTLHDWDFTEFNETLRYFIDELKVNALTIYHTNPTRCNIFRVLPGKPLANHATAVRPRSAAWPQFGDETWLAYGIIAEDPYQGQTIEISRAQYNQLLVDYFRAIAENLEENGWIDKAFIIIDETMNQGRLRHFLSTLKSDPLVARLKIGACMQGYETLQYKLDPEDDTYAFKGLLDFYIPQMDENYNRWEKYLFPDHDIEPDRSRLWNYAVSTSRLAIDTPGVNNRMFALDIFNRGGSGFFVWDTIYWTTDYGGSGNPWINPYCVWGNGAVGFFYPPTRSMAATEPDFSITPSLRVMTFREGVEDYDYAYILDGLMTAGRDQGVDVRDGEQILLDIARSFHNSVHWSQNDAWYIELRDRLARVIVDLQRAIGQQD